jgi:hypothetical protein
MLIGTIKKTTIFDQLLPSTGHYHKLENYKVIKNDCRGFNNFSYTIHMREQYVVAPMDQEILKVFFYDVRCAVVMHFSAWGAVY